MSNNTAGMLDRLKRYRSLTALASIVALACGGGADAISGNVVPDDRVASVRVEPSSITIAIGTQLPLSATAYNAAGLALVGRTFTWSSSAVAVAPVDANGVVVAVSGGSATISAATSGISGSATVSVSSSPVTDTVVASVGVWPQSATLIVGAKTSLGAVATNAAGQPLAGKTFTWASATPSIASVNASGVVTAVAPGGPLSVTASTGGKSAAAAITVSAAPSSTGTITVNGAQQFQTMTGWEALGGTGYDECDRQAYAKYMPELIARAANELKINRLKLPLRVGYEAASDAFLAFQSGQITLDQWKKMQSLGANDNNDPFVINPAGFQWGHLDFGIEQVLLPLKQQLKALGDDLWFTLNYNGSGNSGILYRDNPEEYAELALAAFQHMQQKYGLVPNSLEIVNEPNLGVWTGQNVAAALVAVKRRLNQAGFFPDFVGPSSSGALSAIQFFDQMMRTPGAAQALSELSYHRYGQTLPNYLTDIAQRGAQYRVRTAMTEHIGSGYLDLHDDLTNANVSAWEQFGLAFCQDDNGAGGGLYFVVNNAKPGQTNPRVVTATTSTYLRQYFRYVRLGAVRLGATTGNAAFSPVAFRNADGKYTVVVKATTAGSFTVGGLPAGTYGIEYTTATDYARALPDVTITSAQAVSASIPAAGALTVYAK